jgi:hypothetical protein
VDDAAGNRFYQYDMEQAKAGLLKRGYALSNKQVQLETIEGSAACHRNRREECT